MQSRDFKCMCLFKYEMNGVLLRELKCISGDFKCVCLFK